MIDGYTVLHHHGIIHYRTLLYIGILQAPRGDVRGAPAERDGDGRRVLPGMWRAHYSQRRVFGDDLCLWHGKALLKFYQYT